MVKLLSNQRYHILDRLGTGGMGVVYKAIDTHLFNRTVAIKEISQRNLSQAETLSAIYAFEQEASFLANLSHQNLPRIYDYFTLDSHSYLVMDFIEGETLEALLQKHYGSGFPVQEVLLIGEQLCSVLDYLHTRRPPIIFRDLKPANVMITEKGDHIYLIDFGIARLFKVGKESDTLSFGTPGYAPPEQYGGRTDERSDIYSLGATFYHLLTGQDPAKLETPFCFPPVRTLNPAIPLAWERLLTKMLSLDRNQRPASMTEVKQELLQIKQEMQRIMILQTTGQTATIEKSPPLKPSQGTLLSIYQLHSGSVHAVAWSPMGKYIASAGRDKTVHVWDAATGENVFTYKKHATYVYGLAWSPDGTRLASSCFAHANIWDAISGENPVFYDEHTLWVYALAWSPDGHYVASSAADGQVHIWDALSGTNIYRYRGCLREVRTLAWRKDMSYPLLLAGCDDATIHCWDALIGGVPLTYRGHSKEVRGVSWSPDTMYFASGSRDKTIKLWQPGKKDCLATYQGHTKEIHCISWSPDGKYIASAGEDRTIRIWDIARGETVYVYKGHTREVLALAWSLDSAYIVSACDDKTVHVWQAR